ncbi:serine/threonine-protein kinase [Candidatus Viridilinea mediisalina]|uniref:Protein kinase domain-containing protein n=1 Tax=Candidatus Viridilinea mediisalina TaxID=2024553 RepID=A0A2A6RKK1_9CHLR|nr:serine/threonine-protein kinase [Candidatus Viridilinea mediisalina]PDW03416.1 hypothetical protein CJ255_08790 [Candidatus Viridilinea mediisalina]
MMHARICHHCTHHNRAQARYCGYCGHWLVDTSAVPQVRAPLKLGAVLGSDGRYAIQQLIGKGGFGEAYLAEDLQHWRRLCLIKRLSIQPNTPETLLSQINTNFEREARLLVALNNPGHPNIPEIYQYLPQEQCLVMKYVTGKSLDRILKRQVVPLPEAEALRYVRDACAALVYMHEHDQGPILHRDLKPSNMMLDATGRVFLIDFGLARDQAQHPEQDWGGTHGYMPPEQLAGKPEPRSDVFALGATLYELLTNHAPPPFHQPLIPALTLNPTLRPAVDQLIQRCMAHHVAARPHAAELLTLLDDLLESANLPPPPLPNQLPTKPTLFGREAELARLEAQLASDHFVLLCGMPGVGKTSLAVALAHRYPHPDQVFWHHFQPGEGADRLLNHMAGWLAQRGYPTAWRQIQRHYQAGQPTTPDILVEYVAQAPALAGSLLCLDDLHVVVDDPAIVRVIERLRRVVAPQPPSLLATARTQPAFVATNELVGLHGLNLATTQALLTQNQLDLNASESEQLWRSTEGNPQFLILAMESLQQSHERQTLLTHLNETIALEAYLLHEVDARLSPSEREVMEAVALLLGYGGPRPLIEAILEDEGVRRELTSLSQRQLLIVEPQAGGLCYRQHAMVQAFYYDLQGARRRRERHRRAGAYLVRRNDTLAAARHYARADDVQQAATLLTTTPWRFFNQGQAGEVEELAASLDAHALTPELRVALWTVHGEALARLDRDQLACSLLERALAETVTETPVRRARRYRLLARIYARHGDYERTEAYCRQGLLLALDSANSPIQTEAARLYAQLAEILMRRNDHVGAQQACEAGLATLPPEPAAPAERAALLQRLATLVGQHGNYEQAVIMLETSLGLARQAGDRLLTARVLHNVGHFHSLSGKLARSQSCLNESLQIRMQLGHQLDQVDTLNTLAMIQLASGTPELALQNLIAARDLATRHQLRGSLASIMLSLGQLYYETHEFTMAEQNLVAASAIFTELGEQSEHVRCIILLGDVALAQTQAMSALSHGTKALQLVRELGQITLEASALRVYGEAHIALGDLREANQALTQALQLTEQHGDPYDLALTLWACARLAKAQGEHTAALHYTQRSLELAREQHISHLIALLEAFIPIHSGAGYNRNVPHQP